LRLFSDINCQGDSSTGSQSISRDPCPVQGRRLPDKGPDARLGPEPESRDEHVFRVPASARMTKKGTKSLLEQAPMAPIHASPAYAGTRPLLMTAFVLLIVLGSNCTQLAWRSGQGGNLVPVRFTYLNPQAKEVSVAGSFNAWSPSAHRMVRQGNSWTAEIQLEPGRHTYVFVVDDRTWHTDPKGQFWEDSGFGIRSSVLIVE
jgi:hypothetical protein